MAITKRDNLFRIASVAHLGGKPPFYKTPEELTKRIAEYIDWEDEAKGTDAKGTGKGVYTISGCALFLGFKSKTSFYDYAKKEHFSEVIDRFMLFMTDWNEKKLYWGGTFTGAQFWLKNFGDYKDEVTQNQNQFITQVNPTIVSSDVPLSTSESE